MSQRDKMIKRLLSFPKDMKFDELCNILSIFGYVLSNKGKTSGSRVKFENEQYPAIRIHKPHGNNCVWKLDIISIVALLREQGLLNNEE